MVNKEKLITNMTDIIEETEKFYAKFARVENIKSKYQPAEQTGLKRAPAA